MSTIKSWYQNVECADCGAIILADTRKPLTRDPNEHEEDCPIAEEWGPDSAAELLERGPR